MQISERAEKIASILSNKKGQDIVILKVSDMTIISDYFVVASAPSTTHVQTLAEEVEAKTGEKPLRMEGVKEGRWVVIDYGDVLVHIFHKEEREFYQLERLWKTDNNYLNYLEG